MPFDWINEKRCIGLDGLCTRLADVSAVGVGADVTRRVSNEHFSPEADIGRAS